MLDSIIYIDQYLFKLINSGCQNPVFDFLFPLFRNKFFWIPLYLIISILLIKYYKSKSVVIFIFIIIGLLMSDQISSEIVKKTVERIRPCNDVDFKSFVRLLVPCGSGFSFTSSHAANHFCQATLFYFFLNPLVLNKNRKRLLLSVLLFWASLIGVAQIYVGVHYPTDIIAGAFLGMIIALVLIFIFKRLKFDLFYI
jgi:membrane-associated phospholipid phosphatase